MCNPLPFLLHPLVPTPLFLSPLPLRSVTRSIYVRPVERNHGRDPWPRSREERRRFLCKAASSTLSTRSRNAISHPLFFFVSVIVRHGTGTVCSPVKVFRAVSWRPLDVHVHFLSSFFSGGCEEIGWISKMAFGFLGFSFSSFFVSFLIFIFIFLFWFLFDRFRRDIKAGSWRCWFL